MGKAIIIWMGAFVAFIVTLITILMSNRVDLVSEDYYQREISYSDEMTARENWNNCGAEVNLSQHDNQLAVTLPEIKGVNSFELQFKRPDDEKKDLKFSISDTRTFLVDRKLLNAGQYDYELTASDGKNNYLATGKYYVK